MAQYSLFVLKGPLNPNQPTLLAVGVAVVCIHLRDDIGYALSTFVANYLARQFTYMNQLV